MVILETSKGNIVIDLDYKNAPITSANFEQYVKEGFYDCLLYTSPSPRDA